LSKECDFALDDLNLSFLLLDSGDLILSITKLLNVRSSIWTYQFLQHYRQITTIWPYQVLTCLLSDCLS